MPIKLRCYCGYVLTLQSALAGKDIRCTECDEILKVPTPGQKQPGQKQNTRRSAESPQSRSPARDPWDEDFDPQPRYQQPSYEQQQYYIPGPQYSPTPQRRARKQSDIPIQKLIVFVVIVVFLGGAVLLGIFIMSSRPKQQEIVRRDPRSNPANLIVPVDRSPNSQRTIVNGILNLNINVPERYYILNAEEVNAADDLLKPGPDDVRKMIETPGSQTEKELLLFMAIKDYENDPTENNASIAVAAMRVDNFPGIDSPRNFLRAINREQSYLPGNSFRTAIIRDSFELGNLKTSTMTNSAMENGVTVSTKVFVARVNEYFLGVSISYSSESERQELEDIVRSIQGLF